MRRYWRSIALLVVSFLPSLLPLEQALKGAISAVILLFAIEDFAIEKWGGYKVSEIMSKLSPKAWGSIVLLTGVFTILWAILVLSKISTATFFESVASWFILFGGSLLVILILEALSIQKKSKDEEDS